MISPAMSQLLNLKITGRRYIVGITGQTELVETATADNIGLGEVMLPPFEAALVDVKRLGKKIEFILGVNAFRDRKLQINFNEGTICLLD